MNRQLTEPQVKNLIKMMISTQVNMHYLEDGLRQGWVVKDTKRKTNLLLNQLKNKEQAFNYLADEANEAPITLYENLYDLIEEFSDVCISEHDELKAVIQAFKKDKKSLLGIAKKVLH